jgi:hypothetical protein
VLIIKCLVRVCDIRDFDPHAFSVQSALPAIAFLCRAAFSEHCIPSPMSDNTGDTCLVPPAPQPRVSKDGKACGGARHHRRIVIDDSDSEPEENDCVRPTLPVKTQNLSPSVDPSVELEGSAIGRTESASVTTPMKTDGANEDEEWRGQAVGGAGGAFRAGRLKRQRCVESWVGGFPTRLRGVLQDARERSKDVYHRNEPVSPLQVVSDMNNAFTYALAYRHDPFGSGQVARSLPRFVLIVDIYGERFVLWSDERPELLELLFTDGDYDRFPGLEKGLHDAFVAADGLAEVDRLTSHDGRGVGDATSSTLVLFYAQPRGVPEGKHQFHLRLVVRRLNPIASKDTAREPEDGATMSPPSSGIPVKLVPTFEVDNSVGMLCTRDCTFRRRKSVRSVGTHLEDALSKMIITRDDALYQKLVRNYVYRNLDEVKAVAPTWKLSELSDAARVESDRADSPKAVSPSTCSRCGVAAAALLEVRRSWGEAEKRLNEDYRAKTATLRETANDAERSLKADIHVASAQLEVERASIRSNHATMATLVEALQEAERTIASGNAERHGLELQLQLAEASQSSTTGSTAPVVGVSKKGGGRRRPLPSTPAPTVAPPAVVLTPPPTAASFSAGVAPPVGEEPPTAASVRADQEITELRQRLKCAMEECSTMRSTRTVVQAQLDLMERDACSREEASNAEVAQANASLRKERERRSSSDANATAFEKEVHRLKAVSGKDRQQAARRAASLQADIDQLRPKVKQAQDECRAAQLLLSKRDSETKVVTDGFNEQQRAFVTEVDLYKQENAALAKELAGIQRDVATLMEANGDGVSAVPTEESTNTSCAAHEGDAVPVNRVDQGTDGGGRGRVEGATITDETVERSPPECASADYEGSDEENGEGIGNVQRVEAGSADAGVVLSEPVVAEACGTLVATTAVASDGGGGDDDDASVAEGQSAPSPPLLPTIEPDGDVPLPFDIDGRDRINSSSPRNGSTNSDVSYTSEVNDKGSPSRAYDEQSHGRSTDRVPFAVSSRPETTFEMRCAGAGGGGSGGSRQWVGNGSGGNGKVHGRSGVGGALCGQAPPLHASSIGSQGPSRALRRNGTCNPNGRNGGTKNFAGGFVSSSTASYGGQGSHASMVLPQPPPPPSSPHPHPHPPPHWAYMPGCGDGSQGFFPGHCGHSGVLPDGGGGGGGGGGGATHPTVGNGSTFDCSGYTTPHVGGYMPNGATSFFAPVQHGPYVGNGMCQYPDPYYAVNTASGGLGGDAYGYYGARGMLTSTMGETGHPSGPLPHLVYGGGGGGGGGVGVVPGSITGSDTTADATVAAILGSSSGAPVGTTKEHVLWILSNLQGLINSNAPNGA